MKTPVVLIIFNRPTLTRCVFERVRAARPPKLLIVSDGARATHPGEPSLVEECRSIVEKGVDWPCEVLTNYAGSNMGCMDRIRSGIDWAFGLVEEAVILEDDCLADPSFFEFCDDMLERYRDDERVMNIGGTNFIAPYHRPRTSYWFSRHPWTWGWATWRRAWRHNDFEMATWDERQDALRRSFASNWEAQYWLSTFEQARRNLRETNCWDFQWNYTCRSLGGVAVVPTNNLVENLGFCGGGTHEFVDMERLVVPTQPLGALEHPSRISVDAYADDLWTRVYAGVPISVLNNLKARIRVGRDLFGAPLS
ncbi:MAG TPA: hypothetical protein VIM61_08250 [Chthoniobacterales bacterium]|jgi:hypothetical protein